MRIELEFLADRKEIGLHGVSVFFLQDHTVTTMTPSKFNDFTNVKQKVTIRRLSLKKPL